jgi:murein DD-endopeptidase MepM/ murein hydrolase activator NlpD
VLALASLVIAGISLSGGPLAPAQDLQSELGAKQAQLGQAESQKGVLTSTISRYSDQITQLQGEVATLRNREALVQDDLDEKQAELNRERHRLEVLRAHLKRSIDVLDKRLVAIYKSDTPDVLTVILESDGFNDMLERYEYLQRIESQDSDVIARVRELRNQTRDTVERVRSARNEIRAKRDELARTRSSLEAKESSLTSVRDSKQQALAQVDDNIKQLEGDVGDLQGDIQSQLQGGAALPAGPVRGGSAGFIWPVNGPIVSPFGIRWGSMHEGVDIAVPTGTPIRAAKAGSVRIASPYGGYGNYTCIDHGGGLSTCYAHQSSYVRTSGFVGTGTVIGYVGCTGSCFGDHLHFEIRVNGAAVDPLGYL